MFTLNPINGGDGPKAYERDDLHHLATLAASCRRFDHMFEYMKRLVEAISPHQRLTVSERQSFCFACNALIKARYDAYDYASKIAISCHGIDQKRADAASDYMAVMATEFDAICREAVKIINVNILNPIHEHLRSQLSAEAKIFYRTMEGDFLRQLVIVSTGSENRNFANEAYESYLAAMRDEEHLVMTNPTRLDLRFSLADFLCCIFKQPYPGYKIAREAYEIAIRDLKYIRKGPSEETVESLNRLAQFLFRWKDYEN